MASHTPSADGGVEPTFRERSSGAFSTQPALLRGRGVRGGRQQRKGMGTWLLTTLHREPLGADTHKALYKQRLQTLESGVGVGCYDPQATEQIRRPRVRAASQAGLEPRTAKPNALSAIPCCHLHAADTKELGLLSKEAGLLMARPELISSTQSL